MANTIKFKSGGLNCAADLYLPPDFSSSRTYPGLVLGHGTAQTKKSLVSIALGKAVEWYDKFLKL